MLTRDPNRVRYAVEREPSPAEGVEYARPEEAAIKDARLQLERNKRRLNMLTPPRVSPVTARDVAGFGRRDLFWAVAFAVVLAAFAFVAINAWRAGDCAIETARTRAALADSPLPDSTPAAAPRDSSCPKGAL